MSGRISVFLLGKVSPGVASKARGCRRVPQLMYAEPVRYCIAARGHLTGRKYPICGGRTDHLIYTIPPSGKTTILSAAYEARPLHLVGIVAFNSQIPWTLKRAPFKLIPNEILQGPIAG
ncbi:hypothetical protein MTP99_003552 [Tenebrio molitor]|jgi:hypothetical protein|nr:hypothetical protein MTP99_003552 [Tenebrio molitor]